MTQPGVPTTTVADLPAELPEGSVLLDVREDDEWAAGHAPGAVHVPLAQVPARLAELPADAPLYVVCRSGGRSARATAWLVAQGREAVNVDGGMAGWAAHGRPVVAEGDAAPEII